MSLLLQKLAALDSGRPLPFNFELVEKLDSHARIVRLQLKTTKFARAVSHFHVAPTGEVSCQQIALVRLSKFYSLPI